MTTEAEKVNVVDLEQARIRRSMRGMTGQATLVGLYGRVLEDERPHGIGMALGAHRELAGGGADLVACLGAMGIVTVAALDQSDVHSVAIGPSEFRFLCPMTTEAEVGLGLNQHEINVLGLVRTVAVGAGNTIGQVFRLGEVLRFQAGLVTLGANGGCLGRTQSFKANDLGDVSTTIHMGLRGAMAGLATMLIAFEQRRMRSTGKVLVPDLLVTGFANVGLSVRAHGRTW
jgi:hypothetical protein